ncbi:hypothetical protein AWJ20_5245 [Sugiyamaella lignohabitans]|uniref:Fmo1p n=1 Tax=Sugiyamaella lignohabitans TaxID=796027 RepID=A0A161HFH5_9ASCO|nr:uncharacterized protein AWJ20_5245 [Sugiyamaella lignohabitans]ANB14280.1 hypothetical protein AWJ20_5245 [Sugiyamaella lignohabitans]
MTIATDKRIAIIGAGPSGAIALDTFLEYGFSKIRVFERKKVPGGTWNDDKQVGVPVDNVLPTIDEPNADAPIPVPEEVAAGTKDEPVTIKTHNTKRRYEEASIYPELETNIIPPLMSFRKKPVPKEPTSNSFEKYGEADTFRKADTINRYVTSFFEGRDNFVSYNTTVEKAEQPEGPGTPWVLTLRKSIDAENSEWWSETFDFLYVAIGRFNVPRADNIPGLKEAAKIVPPGTILHTKYYRDPKHFSGKKTLIVGAAFSSIDIVHLVRDYAQAPLYLSANIVIAFILDAFKQPFVDARGRIAKIEVNKDGKTIDAYFEDGSVVDQIERLVLSTGYKTSYPFLEEYTAKYGGLVTKDNLLKNTYLTTWWNQDPSLAIAGVFTDGVLLKASETQAAATAGLWSGLPGSGLPSKEEQIKWETDRRNNQKLAVEWHIWFPDFGSILNQILQVGGGSAQLSKISGVDFSDSDELANYQLQSFGLKSVYWSKVAKDWIEKHPDSQDRYNKTVEYIDSIKWPKSE